MAQPFVAPCERGIIDAEPCPRALGREIPLRQRRMVLAACVLASLVTHTPKATAPEPTPDATGPTTIIPVAA